MEKNEMQENFNTQDKLCIVFVLDTSESMAGTPINELNDYVKVLFEDIKEDNVASQRLEIGIVTFDSTVNLVRKPENVWNNTIIPHLTLGGLNTSMVDGIREAIMLVNATKDYYKSTNQGYYKPLIILVSNNFYSSVHDINIITQEIKAGVNSQKYLFYLIAVEGSNMNKIQQVSSNISYAIKLQDIRRLQDFIYSSDRSYIEKSTKDAKIIFYNGMDSWKDFMVD